MKEKNRKNQKHIYSDKLKVVELYNKDYGSTSISKEFQISKIVVKAWLSIYRSKGLLGLEKLRAQLVKQEGFNSLKETRQGCPISTLR